MFQRQIILLLEDREILMKEKIWLIENNVTTIVDLRTEKV